MTKPLKRIPQGQTKDEGGKVVTPVRLRIDTWRTVQRLANARRITASRLIAELVEGNFHAPDQH